MVSGRAVVKARTALVLTVVAQMFWLTSAPAQSSNVLGHWRVEITFGNDEKRTVKFEAGTSGKGSFSLLGPKQNLAEQTENAGGEWIQSDERLVTFSGPVQFPLGNVGLMRGTLILKGRLGNEGSLTGEATFFPADQDPKDPAAQPSKSGSFQAVRSD